MFIMNWPGIGAREEGEVEQGKEEQADHDDSGQQRQAQPTGRFRTTVITRSYRSRNVSNLRIEPGVEAVRSATGFA